MENAVELMNNEVTETVAAKVVSEGAEIVSKTGNKYAKYGLVGLGVVTLIGMGVHVYIKHKNTKLISHNASTDSQENDVHTADREESEEE